MNRADDSASPSRAQCSTYVVFVVAYFAALSLSLSPLTAVNGFLPRNETGEKCLRCDSHTDTCKKEEKKKMSQQSQRSSARQNRRREISCHHMQCVVVIISLAFVFHLIYNVCLSDFSPSSSSPSSLLCHIFFRCFFISCIRTRHKKKRS